MRQPTYLLGLLVASTLSLAQDFVPSSAEGSFPACAASCAILQQAQDTCVQQTSESNNRLAAENCFCQSASLQLLYTSPDALCVAECPQPSDRVNLRTWFQGFCQQVGQGVDPASTSSPATTLVTVTSTNTPEATAGSDGATAGATRPSAPNNQSWIEGHWKWVLMVGILAIGLAAFAWLLIWLKKRHRRKVEERRAREGGFPTPGEKARGARSATPDLWGPHQHMHATRGWENHGPITGVIPSENDKRERRRSRQRSSKPGSRTRQPAPEIEEARPPASRQPSSHSKSRDQVGNVEVPPEPPQHRSRSHNRSRKGKKYDFDRDVNGS